ncbi:MAG: EF-P lysine aminoacylase EpmA [Steroidobacteraceae bacterium]|jgi:lysyl-tRNA synthetase class 2
MNAQELWRPSASMPTLRLRARLLAAVRTFFAARDVLEVDTPCLVRHAVTDVHIHCATVQLPGHAAPLYLHSSPEYAMKRMLAAGSGDIFQITHVFRGHELSPLHNAEFTLIEWYRCGYSMAALMTEVAQLAGELLALPASAPVQELRYVEAFEQELGVHPLRAQEAALRAVALAHGLEPRVADGCNRDELLDWLMASVLAARLGRSGLCFLHHYPASQAALARLDPQDPQLAMRFELYRAGVELANGFEELSDAAQQRARFELDRQERIRRGLSVPSIDEALLAALGAGMSAVAGVALGFDRLLMLRLGAERIEQVLPFALERA